MILLTGVSRETIKITGINDTIIPIDIIKVISESAHEQPITSRDMIHVIEASVDSEIIHPIVLPLTLTKPLSLRRLTFTLE